MELFTPGEIKHGATKRDIFFFPINETGRPISFGL